MSGRRIASLFIYAFASMTFPIVLLLAINEYTGQALTSWMENNLAVTILGCLAYGLAQIFLILLHFSRESAYSNMKEVFYMV